MTDSKSLFISQKALAEWWGSVVSNPNYDTVMLHARATALEQVPDASQRDGALHFAQILSTLHQPTDAGSHFPRPRLNHKFDDKKEPKKK